MCQILPEPKKTLRIMNICQGNIIYSSITLFTKNYKMPNDITPGACKKFALPLAYGLFHFKILCLCFLQKFLVKSFLGFLNGKYCVFLNVFKRIFPDTLDCRTAELNFCKFLTAAERFTSNAFYGMAFIKLYGTL